MPSVNSAAAYGRRNFIGKVTIRTNMVQVTVGKTLEHEFCACFPQVSYVRCYVVNTWVAATWGTGTHYQSQ